MLSGRAADSPPARRRDLPTRDTRPPSSPNTVSTNVQVPSTLEQQTSLQHEVAQLKRQGARLTTPETFAQVMVEYCRSMAMAQGPVGQIRLCSAYSLWLSRCLQAAKAERKAIALGKQLSRLVEEQVREPCRMGPLASPGRRIS